MNHQNMMRHHCISSLNLQVNINACLSAVSVGSATAEATAAERDMTAIAEPKWKSSNVKAIVTNGKSLAVGGGAKSNEIKTDSRTKNRSLLP